MKIRLPPFGTIVRPFPEGLSEEGETAVDPGPPAPSGRTVASIDATSEAPGGRKGSRTLLEAFASLAGEDVRTKPSYTDCWIAGVPELRAIASYMTSEASVTIGESASGETSARPTGSAEGAWTAIPSKAWPAHPLRIGGTA